MAHAEALEADGHAPAAGKAGGRKKLIVIAVPVVILLLVAGLWFSGILPKLLGHGAPEAEKAHAAEAPPSAPIFFDLPEMVTNLNGNPRRPSYAKFQAKLELARKEDVPIVQAALPRLLDLFQTYLREMRPEDLRGSAGTYRLREELIARGNLAVAPAHINDVLFPQMLVQ